MFINVITGYFSTFKVTFLGQGQRNSAKICVLLYTINKPNIKKISIMVIEISLERTNFEVSSLGVLDLIR